MSFVRSVLLSALLPALLISTEPPSAADEIRADFFTHVTIADGLPHRRTYAIDQDPRGFLWFATQAGLVRYDGYDLLVHRHRSDDPNSLPDDYLLDLQIDGDGVLWMATKRAGLVRFSPAENRFDSWPIDFGGELHLTTQGEVFWSAEKLYRFDRDRQEPVVVWQESGALLAGLTEDPDGDLWMGDHRFGLIRCRPSGEDCERREIEDSSSIHDLYHDGEFLWISTSGRGLWRRTPESGEMLRLHYDPADPAVGSAFVLQTIRRGEEIWVATNRGVDVLNRNGKRVRGYRHDPSNPRSLANDFVTAMFVDRSGALWAGSGAGLSRTAAGQTAFSSYRKGSEGAAASLPSGSVYAVVEDRDGALWIGGSAGEIARIDAARTHVESIPRPEGGDSATSLVWAAIQTGDGTIFFGTDLGVERYVPELGRLQAVAHRVEDPIAEFTRVTTLFEDSRSRLWIGADEGLRLYDADQELYSNPVPEIGDRILALDESPDGSALWVGLDSDGLLRIDAETLKVERVWAKDPGNPAGLQNGIVSDVHFDRNGTLWVATLGGGLHRGSADGGFKAFRMDDGLPSDSIGAILEDREGFLWLAAATHLARFDPRTGDVLAFNERDGLPAAFPTEPGFASSSGELLFPGVGGFFTVRPERLLADPHPPVAVLTEFRLFNQPVAPGPNAPIRRSVSAAREIVLRHDQNFFSLGFAALHGDDPQRHRYAYRLEGAPDDRWIETDASRRFAQFTNLPSGMFTFHVKAAHRDGAWSDTDAQIGIRILPAPWRTWWAYSLYVVALLGSGAWYVRSQRREIRREREMADRERTINRKLREIDRRKDELVAEKISRIKILEGILPICAHCKKIRDDDGEWNQLEVYIDAHSEAEFSHGYCPECVAAFQARK